MRIDRQVNSPRLVTRYLAIATVLAIVTSSVQARAPVTLSAVSAHLFLENTGELSADVWSMSEFYAVNGRPDVGDFPENSRFSSFVIKLRFQASGEAFEPKVVAEVRLTDKKTKKVIVNQSVRGVYIGPSGITFVPIYVEHHECDWLIVEVRSGGKVVTKELPFVCGE
jgi:hypothetical protein